MNITNARSVWNSSFRLTATLTFPCVMALTAIAGDAKQPAPVVGRSVPTDMDLAADVSRYFGQRANLYRDNNRKLAKLDLDADLNYDGTVDNYDPADNGAFESTPPGLVVGVGELSRLVIRVTPYKIDFNGHAKFRIQVDGINRDEKSGKFAEGAEMSGMGHIRVWRDASKKEKILDSRDPNMRVYDWTLESRSPANLQMVPRTLFVEGVSPSPLHSGDIRLLVSVFDDSSDNKANYDPSKWIKTFRPSYDHLLLTVTPKAHQKVFINNNSEGVWVSK